MADSEQTDPKDLFNLKLDTDDTPQFIRTPEQLRASLARGAQQAEDRKWQPGGSRDLQSRLVLAFLMLIVIPVGGLIWKDLNKPAPVERKDVGTKNSKGLSIPELDLLNKSIKKFEDSKKERERARTEQLNLHDAFDLTTIRSPEKKSEAPDE